ncbi:NAD(P)-dependent Metabolic Enzyme [Abortiporus biennis]
MRVLVIGATGFIGLPATQALVRAGHIVYGLTRTAEKAKQLQAEEVIPIIGEYLEPSKWLTPSLIATLDVVINAVGSEVRFKDPSADPRVFKVLIDVAQQSRPSHAPKLNYIVTSGTLLYGPDHKEIVTDTTSPPIEKLFDLVKPFHEFEQEALHSTVVNTLIIRPGLVYGRSGSLTARLFSQAKEGETIKWFGGPNGRVNAVHTDDLANLYVLATEKAHLVGGNIFAGVNDASESTEDILRNLVSISGAKGFEYVEPSNPFEGALATSITIRPYLGRTLLGWRPVKASIVDHLQIYFDTWKASVETESSQ